MREEITSTVIAESTDLVEILKKEIGQIDTTIIGIKRMMVDTTAQEIEVKKGGIQINRPLMRTRDLTQICNMEKNAATMTENQGNIIAGISTKVEASIVQETIRSMR